MHVGNIQESSWHNFLTWVLCTAARQASCNIFAWCIHLHVGECWAKCSQNSDNSYYVRHMCLNTYYMYIYIYMHILHVFVVYTIMYACLYAICICIRTYHHLISSMYIFDIMTIFCVFTFTLDVLFSFMIWTPVILDFLTTAGLAPCPVARCRSGHRRGSPGLRSPSSAGMAWSVEVLCFWMYRKNEAW